MIKNASVLYIKNTAFIQKVKKLKKMEAKK